MTGARIAQQGRFSADPTRSRHFGCCLPSLPQFRECACDSAWKKGTDSCVDGPLGAIGFFKEALMLDAIAVMCPACLCGREPLTQMGSAKQHQTLSRRRKRH
jgi:hypothetical protein